MHVDGSLRGDTEENDEVIVLNVRPRIKLIASTKYLLHEKIICSHFQTAYSSIQKSDLEIKIRLTKVFLQGLYQTDLNSFEKGVIVRSLKVMFILHCLYKSFLNTVIPMPYFEFICHNFLIGGGLRIG